MPAVIESFSCTYHRLPIRKGFGAEGEKLEDFLHEFRQNYYPNQKVVFADPELVWQGCQYDGHVCVGVFNVHTLTHDGSFVTSVGIIQTNVHHMERFALSWFLHHRQKSLNNSGTWPIVEAPAPYDHCGVYPILVPETGML